MNLHRRRFLLLASAAAAAVPSICCTARADTYPHRPVRIVVPYAPGGPTDVITRVIAQKLSDSTGKQFFVENMGGGGGNVGMGRVATMPADGYTLLMINPSYVTNPILYEKVPYEFGKSFDPVTLAVTTTLMIVIHPSVPARTLEQLAGLIKASPGKFSYSSPGVGTPGHLVGAIVRPSLGLAPAHGPFNGAGPAVASAVAGHTPICFASPSPAAQQVVEGNLRGLAVTSRQRTQALPDLPTTAEAGYPAIVGDNWQGIVVPAGTPGGSIAFVHREGARIVALPDVKERLTVLGFEPVGGTPEEFAAHAKAEYETWANVIRESKIRAQ